MVAVRKDGLEVIPMSREEYLKLDASSEEKYEYYAGYARAMTGASRYHNLIVTNLIVTLGVQLKAKPCLLYPSDMRVLVSDDGEYVYPDVSIACGEPRFDNTGVDTLINPVVIIEVLSPSTERSDRGDKFARYRSIESLQEYVLVSQHEARIEHFTRQSSSEWLYREYSGLEATFAMASLECTLALRDVYDKVNFNEADPA